MVQYIKVYTRITKNILFPPSTHLVECKTSIPKVLGSKPCIVSMYFLAKHVHVLPPFLVGKWPVTCKERRSTGYDTREHDWDIWTKQ